MRPRAAGCPLRFVQQRFYPKSQYAVSASGTDIQLSSANVRFLGVKRTFKWILHPNWYTTAACRAKNNGMLGLSNGCITVDPAENNKLVMRLQGGALVYVTVGDDPIEQYL